MARFRSSQNSVSALATATGFFWLMGAATRGFFLRRVTLGVIVTTAATVPTSQQVQVNISLASSAGTTPTAATNGISALNSQLNATPLIAADSAFVTPPTTTGSPYVISFNTQSAVDLPWEQSDEWLVPLGTANGLAFINAGPALPANHQLTITTEWEE